MKAAIQSLKQLPPLDAQLHPVLAALIEVTTTPAIAQYLASSSPAKHFKAGQLADIQTWAQGLS